MSRVYTVKSNACRDCRKLGLNPDLVIPQGGGWVIDYPDVPGAKPEKPARASKVSKPKAPKKEPKAAKTAKPKKAKAPKIAKAPRAPRQPRDGEPKRDRLIAMLADWTPISELMKALGWQAHTVRGALSTAASVRGITIERQRVDKVTSYRVVA